MSNSDIEQSGTVKGHLPNGASLSGRISNGLSLSGHISIGGASDFIIKMTVEGDDDGNYTVTSCDATVEQIDDAFNADKNIVLTVSIGNGAYYYVLPLISARPGLGYVFESFYAGSLLLATIVKEEDGTTFEMTEMYAEDIAYYNNAMPNVTDVQTALDELVPKSHTHANKDTLDKLSVLNGKLQYNGSDVGLKPVKGTDYWTESDKAEIVADTLAALPTWTGGSY